MIDRASSYWPSQAARVGWFLGQYLATQMFSHAGRSVWLKRPLRAGTVLSGRIGEILALFREDLKNIRAGVYRAPQGFAAEVRVRAVDALRYFGDLPAVEARRARGGHDDVRQSRGLRQSHLPGYYVRNFHYQTDGYLSAHSAALYDQQVEVLFIGSAEAMRRQALVPVAGFVRRRRGRPLRHLDIACGTGCFLADVQANFPQLRSVGLDLSVPYLQEARRRHLVMDEGVPLVNALAEALPIADASIDLVTCVYLLHEVPPAVRGDIAREVGRVLRPGGRLVVLDSLQYGDRPEWDGLLTSFPKSFHEPFYADYAGSDLSALFAAAGLHAEPSRLAFLSKVIAFDKPVLAPTALASPWRSAATN